MLYPVGVNQAMQIGELAKATGCPIETIRYWEREGLLAAPTRSEGNYRLYGATDVDQLRFVRNCRSLDMTLDEIRSLLAFRGAPDEKCEDVNLLLDEHIGHVAVRIAELRALKAQLIDIRRRCREVKAVASCGIMRTLERDTPSPKQTGGQDGHVRRTHR